MAERDLSFETLVEVTGATVASERGALNAALKLIREAEPELDDEDLALVIKLRAEDYRRHYSGMALTPTALAKHWNRIRHEVERAVEEAPKPTYPSGTPDICTTCDGHRMVLVSLRPSENPTAPYEEWAPCPDCNGHSVAWWRHDGTHFRTPDPDEVRRMIES